MKIVEPLQMKDLENEAYRNGASEADFMEEAGSGVALVVHEFVEKYGIEHQVILLCGKGNNGGDAYVAGIHLLHLDYHVHAYQLFPLNECSPLCQTNAERFQREGGIITDLGFDDEIPFPLDGVILDGIFGTGFKGVAQGPVASYIGQANESGLPIIAVDIPSGLEGDTGKINGPVILAAETAFLGLPKQGFFLEEGWNAVGRLRHVDFGLQEHYYEDLPSPLEMLTPEMMLPLMPAFKRTRHKYEAGYVVGLAGSSGLPGAASLASIAALRGGAGIVRLLHPEEITPLLVAAPFEIIKTPMTFEKIEAVLPYLEKASAVFIGPGLGKEAKVHKGLEKIVGKMKVPCVLDADALNLYAEEPFALPEKVIMTPHVGEAHRLLGIKKTEGIHLNFLKKCQKFAEENNVTFVLKGGPTFIFHPGKAIYVSPMGDPGMATAGCGDILTGLIAALLAQGLSPLDAACLGVYLHGAAGEEAALELTSYCMVASDLLDFFPAAFSFATR